MEDLLGVVAGWAWGWRWGWERVGCTHVVHRRSCMSVGRGVIYARRGAVTEREGSFGLGKRETNGRVERRGGKEGEGGVCAEREA